MEAQPAWRFRLLHVLSLAVFCATALIIRSLFHRFRLRKFPRVGIDPGVFGLKLQAAKREFYEHGYELVSNGYKQVRSSFHTPLMASLGGP